MSTPFLIADAAEVAVMSPLAEAAFGSYDLQVPEGIDIEDIHDFEAPGNELGHVARLSPQRATGIARRFIRADVAVAAKDDTDLDVIPESDVDRVLSEAESRVESEFFLESDITKAGLGSWVPYVDFNVGDLVNVRIFDIWVKLPVTRIEPIISEGDIVDWRVHVGGQLLSDDQAREVENATIQKELIQDRRDLAGIDAKATKAVKDSSEAKSMADNALQATANNRTYIDEQLELAGAAVEQGREYLRQMEEHVEAGNAAAGRAEDLAVQAAAAADEAVRILDQLDPLRDDVAAAHAEVARLHEQASQFTEQAAEHVRKASQHAATAKGYAEQALEHEAEGRRQATAALNAAGAAQDSAALAQSILDDADGILSQVSGYSQEAKDALSDAESLLANAGGQGKSLGDVLLEVAQKHQETLGAHQDILDLHGEVLEKHSEAIRYVAVAAAQAGSAAMYAAQAAQEALNVAADAARAAGSAADAADEAAQAASNNSAAIGKLQEADGKLQEVDQKLQQQINILEESQELLANAVKILAGAVAQAAMAAQSALDAADNAGKAAGEALTASEHNSSALEAMQETYQIFMDTKNVVDTRQDAALEQLKGQAADIVQMQNESANIIMATQAGTSYPGVDVRRSTDGTYDWEFTVPDTKGALAKIEFWRPTTYDSYELSDMQVLAVSSSGKLIRTFDGRFVQVTWTKAKAVQRTITQQHLTAFTPNASTWTTISGLTISARADASRGYLKAKVVWHGPSDRSRYIIRIVADGREVARNETTGTLTWRNLTHTVEAANVSVAAGKNVQVQVWSDHTVNAERRRVNSAQLDGTWIETQ